MNKFEQHVAEQYKHIAAGIVLYSGGEVLIGEITNQNGWSIFKGEVDKEDPSYLDAALRELHEESNIYISGEQAEALQQDNSLFYIHSYKVNNKNKLVVLFLLLDKTGEIRKNADLKCNSFFTRGDSRFPEISGYKWVPIDDLENHLIKSQRGLVKDLKILKEILEKEENI